MWIHGPFPCGLWSDVKIFTVYMISVLKRDENVVADVRYRNTGCTPPVDVFGDEEALPGRIEARHDSCNACLKQINIWASVSRVAMLVSLRD